MNKEQVTRFIEIFQKNHRILRRSEAARYGIPPHQIYQMLSRGVIAREERGLYRLTSDPPLSHPDLVKVSLLIPKAIICLVSALYHYNLTTQIPQSIDIALPSSVKAPRLAYPPTDVVWLAEKSYSAGVDIQMIDDVPVKMFSPEKTLTDCFKFRKKIGEEIALEALKEYMKRGHARLDKITEYAKINRVEKIMRPYLESLI